MKNIELVDEEYLNQNAYIMTFEKEYVSDKRYALKEILQYMNIPIKNKDTSWRTKKEIKNDVMNLYSKLDELQQYLINQFEL